MSQFTSVTQVRRRIAESIRALPSERISIRQAPGRFLAEDIVSPLSIPRADNSAMDGYAFSFDGLTEGSEITLPVFGESLAGHPFPGSVAHGQAIRITTGALLPVGLDTVIAYEKTKEGESTVSFAADAVKRGANVRRAGENITAGDIVLKKGTRLSAAQTALIASLGIAEVAVAKQPSAVLILTGDELVNPGEPCRDDQVYDTNSYAVSSLLLEAGARVHVEKFLADDPEPIERTLREALAKYDMVLLSGGAAKSKMDYSGIVLARLGDIPGEKIAMRPGSPMRFGLVSGKPVFVLPGNPVAAFVTFRVFVRGAVRIMQGASSVWPEEITAVSEKAIRTKTGRDEFQRGVCSVQDGKITVRPTPDQSSAYISSLAQANCIIHIGSDEQIGVGDVVHIDLTGAPLAGQ